MASTTPDSIPYPVPTDTLASLDEYLLNLATRLQALHEDCRGGSVSITPTAIDTPTTLRVDFGRTYTMGNPHVVACLGESVATPAKAAVWVTGVDSEGFTLGITADSTAARTVRWVAVKNGTA